VGSASAIATSNLLHSQRGLIDVWSSTEAHFIGGPGPPVACCFTPHDPPNLPQPACAASLGHPDAAQAVHGPTPHKCSHTAHRQAPSSTTACAMARSKARCPPLRQQCCLQPSALLWQCVIRSSSGSYCAGCMHTRFCAGPLARAKGASSHDELGASAKCVGGPCMRAWAEQVCALCGR